MRKKIDIQDLLVWAFRDHVEAGVADPPPDALSVYWAVMALPSAEAELIARHARTGVAPDWRPDGAPVEHLGEMRRQRAVYADWVMSMVTKPLALTWGVTSMTTPVSRYCTLFTVSGALVRVLVAVWVTIGTTSPTCSRAT